MQGETDAIDEMAAKPYETNLEQRAAWIQESLAARHIAFNVSMLDLFIRKMAKHDISIAIVEGHYNPSAMNSEIRRLRQTALRKLEELSNNSSNAIFIPRETVYSFSAEDYANLTHVEPDAGEIFAGRVVELLEHIENPNRPGLSPD